MNFSHCPFLDRLGSELIEAYRRIDDMHPLWPVRSDLPDEISAIHHRMAEHRRSCPFCHQIANFPAATRQPATQPKHQ